MGRLDRLRREWPDVLLALGCALASIWVYRPVFGAYFSPDDLILLERERGLSPPLTTLWRYVSGRLYFDLVTPWFGVDPRPYMMVNVVLHAACVVLLYAFARRHGGRLAATVAAGLFGTSRLFYSVVSQVVGLGEMLALAFTLAAAIALSARDPRWRRAALPLFVLALLSKESVALLPLPLLFSPAVGDALRERARRVAPLLAASLVVFAYVLFSGIRQTALGGKPYETGWGSNLVTSLAVYLDWSVNVVGFNPDYYGASTKPNWATVVVVSAVAAFLAWLSRRHTRAPFVGEAWWLLGLLPVIPLLWQRYLHYLYAPLAGLALAIGGIFEWATLLVLWRRAPEARVRKGARRVPARSSIAWRIVLAWVGALVLLGLHAARSDALLHERLARRLPYADIPFDPLVRKAELARRVATRVQAALGDRPARVVFYVPQVGENRYFARLLESVFDHGRALRALCPGLDSVAFVSRWTPGYRDFELFAGSVDGYVDHLGRGPQSHLDLAAKLMRFRLRREADEHLRAASTAYPQDARLILARAIIADQHGQFEKAAELSRKTIELEPGGPLADSARAMLRRLDGDRARD